MRSSEKNPFTSSIRGKVIVAFITGCVAFCLALAVGNIAFKEMLATVRDVSAPNQKLRIVNSLYRDITTLDQYERSRALKSKGDARARFLNSSKKLRLTLDSLSKLYQVEPAQLNRIDSMKRILTQRDTLFLNYLKVRQSLVNVEGLSRQLNSLSGLISKSSAEKDSSVITTEQRKLITTIIDDPQEKEEKGFLGRLFGKKKEEPKSVPREVITEEINVKIDTVAQAKKEAVTLQMQRAVNNLESRQRQKTENFVNRELALAEADNELVSQMLSLLKKVEEEVIGQADKSELAAQEVVATNAERIGLILIVFFVITAVLVYYIFTDVSKANQYRRDLEFAKDEAEYHSMAKQRFLSSMSHEIRTPLQSIIGYSELIREAEKPKKRDIEAIYQSSIHLLHIVNEVLDYSRIISGKFKFQRLPFNMDDLIQEVISIMRPQAEKKSLALLVHNKITTHVHILGDAFRLKQILFNLIGNAIKFTDRGEVSLTISCERKEGGISCCFSVKDTGHGIDKESIDQIFEEFEQEGSSSSAIPTGTGLGLSIVKKLIEAQGGTIQVESEPGKGSCFMVKLRLKEAIKPKHVASSNNVVVVPGDKKIWIVDDDLFILQLCSAVFKKHDIKHECFSSPVKLLEEQWDDSVSLILMDMRMPEMNGVELCRQLKMKLPSHVKIYALTAQVLPEEREVILAQGFDGLLLKPFREAELLKLVGKEVKESKVAQPEALETFDISAIEKMTFGDRGRLKMILESFIVDTSNDITEIRESMITKDAEKLVLLVHRVAGRTAQMGAKGLAAKFRQEEVALHQDKLPGKEQQERIAGYLEVLSQMIAQLQETLEVEDYSVT